MRTGGVFPKRYIASGLLHRKPAGISGSVALTYRHNDNILGRYETTDEEIISEILQALRETTIVSKAFSGSTDSRILEFETADGDTCLFWFDENRFHGAGGTSYVLSGDEEIWDLAQKIQETYPEYREAME